VQSCEAYSRKQANLFSLCQAEKAKEQRQERESGELNENPSAANNKTATADAIHRDGADVRLLFVNEIALLADEG
jgi:hypothetical protein